MDLNVHTTPHKLEHYSFLWSEVRLLVAALALFLGGYPPVYLLTSALPFLYNIASSLLTLAWIISGVASLYLAYRWYNNNQMLFGGKDMKDRVAFFVSVVSGVNLGLTGLLSNNIGMSMVNFNKSIFFLAGLVYVVAAVYLYKRWEKYGKRLF